MKAPTGAALPPADNESSGGLDHISSSGGDTSPAGLSGYAMTKAAVNALTRAATRGWEGTALSQRSLARLCGNTDGQCRYVDERGQLTKPCGSGRCSNVGAHRRSIGGTPSDIAFAMLYWRPTPTVCHRPDPAAQRWGLHGVSRCESRRERTPVWDETTFVARLRCASSATMGLWIF